MTSRGDLTCRARRWPRGPSPPGQWGVASRPWARLRGPLSSLRADVSTDKNATCLGKGHTSPVVVGRNDAYHIEHKHMKEAVRGVSQPRPDHALRGGVHAERDQDPRHHAAYEPARVEVDPECAPVACAREYWRAPHSADWSRLTRGEFRHYKALSPMIHTGNTMEVLDIPTIEPNRENSLC